MAVLAAAYRPAKSLLNAAKAAAVLVSLGPCRMTTAALCLLVGTCKLESCPCRMCKLRPSVLPGLFVMAARAAFLLNWCQARRRALKYGSVYIYVAAGTALGSGEALAIDTAKMASSFVRRCAWPVTGAAFGLLVRSAQCKSGPGRVVKAIGFPLREGSRLMAVAAILNGRECIELSNKGSKVGVLVAGTTLRRSRRELHFARGLIAQMTTRARYCGMAMFEGKDGACMLREVKSRGMEAR